MSDPMEMLTAWEYNDEDEARACCACGWAGPWRDHLLDVRRDYHQHFVEKRSSR